MSTLTDTLRTAIAAGDGVIRIRATLEPASGNKILPSTYAGGVHNLTAPRPDGTSEWCSVDSPASFANRVEAMIYANFPRLAPLRVQVGDRTISTLQMPHRAFDATLRQSALDGTAWAHTDIAKSISNATPQAAYPLLNYDPCMLLLGGWDSTKLGERTRGTHELKLPAALSGEITATDVMPVQRAGSRIDPLGIEGTEANVVEFVDGRTELYDSAIHAQALAAAVPASDGNKYPRLTKPSEINLGNVTPGLSPKGVLVRGEITLNAMLDLRRLGRYRCNPAADADVVLLLALVGLYGVDAVLRRGLDLRRDCELLAAAVTVELGRPCAEPLPLNLSSVDADLSTELARMGAHIAEPITTQGDPVLRRLAGCD